MREITSGCVGRVATRGRPCIVALVLQAMALAAPALGSPDGGAEDAGATALAGADAGVASSCPDLTVIAAAVEGDARLRAANECLPEELAKLAVAVKMLAECASGAKPAKTWIFPVAGVPPSEAIGGGGSGFIKNRGISCYVTPWAGHPAHDLFVDDPHYQCRDKSGKPFPALAVEDGYVLVAHTGWKPADKTRGGNYVMLYLPGRKQIAYYAHLDQVLVKAGDKVAAGQIVGTLGRTGANAVPRRSQTHLHFGLWDAATFRPVNSLPLLRAARVLDVGMP